MQVPEHVHTVRQLEKGASQLDPVRGTESLQNGAPGRPLGISPIHRVEFTPNAFHLLPKSLGVHGEILVQRGANGTGNEEASSDAAIRFGVGLTPVEVLEDRPSGERLAFLGTGTGRVPPRTRSPAIQILMKNHGCRFASDEHQLVGDFHSQPRPRRQRVDHEEPRPCPVATHGDTAGAAHSRDGNLTSALHIGHVEEARHTFAPGHPARLGGEVPSRGVSYEVEQAVDMDKSRPVLVDPNHRGAIPTDQLLSRGEVPQQARACRVSSVERRGLLRPFCPPTAVVCKAWNVRCRHLHRNI